eukprot:1257097-Pyramimonas_sp.AAC.1
MLSSRIAGRMGAFMQVAGQSIFANFSDQFWTVQWAADVCGDNDIIGEHRLVVGKGFDAVLTQDAQKAFSEAVEASRHASELLKVQVGLT